MQRAVHVQLAHICRALRILVLCKVFEQGAAILSQQTLQNVRHSLESDIDILHLALLTLTGTRRSILARYGGGAVCYLDTRPSGHKLRHLFSASPSNLVKGQNGLWVVDFVHVGLLDLVLCCLVPTLCVLLQ